MSSRVHLRLTSADPARTLHLCGELGIPVSRLAREDDLTVSFWIPGGDLKRTLALCRKRGDSLTVLGRKGLFFEARALLRRPVLVLGVLALTVLNGFLPSRILFFRVEGNEAVPARQILEAAQESGLGFGASRRALRSEVVKNALLERLPELQWAGVNTTGSTAVISVRERSQSRETAQISPQSSLVASRDGFLLTVHTERGTPLVSPGQVVRAGQTLISGYTDCGICIRATGAAGEVFAQTKRDFRAVTPAKALRLAQTGEVRRAYSILFQKKRIKLWKDSGISDATCGRMERQYQFTLPGGFPLPLALCVEEFTSRTWRTEALEEPGPALRQFAETCLNAQMVSGELLGRSESLFQTEELYGLEGTYDCREMIGRVKEIGETNGKRD